MGVFFNVFILQSCARTHVCVRVCECRCPQKLEALESLQLELQAVVRHCTRNLETEHGSSARALLVLLHQGFSTAPRSVLKLEAVYLLTMCVVRKQMAGSEGPSGVLFTTDQTKAWT